MFKRKWLGLNFVLLSSIAAFTAMLVVVNAPELHQASRAFERIQALQPLTLAQLRDTPHGATVAVEGRISADTSPVYRSLVAYAQREGSSVYGYYRTDETQTPPLSIELADGAIQITGPYEIHNPPTRLQTSSSGNRGFFGFTAGQQVTVLGVIVRAGDDVAFNAEVVSGSTFSNYVGEKFLAASWPLWFGLGAAVLTLLGTLAVGLIAQHGGWTASHWSPEMDDLPDDAADGDEWDWTKADDNEVEGNETRGNSPST
jgi:hypothetical protein